MKCLGKIAVCLAGGLVLSTGARAADAVSTDNPYGPIVVRNMFGLNPPQPVDPNASATQADPPPKITPNGIMSIFGQLQVLYKVAPKAGQPGAKEESYVLSEGQQQDDIEVTHINEKGCIVTFNNHGTVQEIPLANTPAINTPAPGPASSGNSGGGGTPSRIGGTRPSGGPGGRFGGQNRGVGNGNNNTGMGGGPALNTVPTSSSYGGQQPSQNTFTPEQQVIMMEVQRAQWQKEGNPAHAIIPHTLLTPGAEDNADSMSPIP